MSGPEPGEDRPPISWEALAAELAAEQDRAAGRPAAAEEAWDAAAAEEEATVEEAPHLEPPARLRRAPSPAPVELEVVDPPEPAVEELVPADEDAALFALARAAGDRDPAELRGGLEALLFVVDAPVDEATLAAALQCPVREVRAGLVALAEEYEQRRGGVTLRRVGEGWRVYTREEHAAVVERYLLEGQRSRLTQAALETLAVVAYRQPVTRARISAIRGVGVDAVVRTLVNRGLISECGSDPDTGGGLYATTPLFLERLGLTSLAELPALAPLVPETSTLLAEHPDD